MKKIKMPKRLYESLFKTIDLFVGSSGGDGGAFIICKYYDYKDLANKYEECQKHNPFTNYKKHECEEEILFTDERDENVMFVNYNDKKVNTLR